MSIFSPPRYDVPVDVINFSKLFTVKTVLFVLVLVFFLASVDNKEISSTQYDQLYQLSKSDPVLKRKVEKAKAGNGRITPFEYNEIVRK